MVLTGELPTGLTADTWLRVTGRYDGASTTDPVNGGRIPALAVDSAERVDPPAEQYE